MRDPQRTNTYAWEDGWMGSNARALSISGARNWVRWACGQYGVKPPVVRGHRRVYGGTSFYDPNTHAIEFRKRHLNVWVALHEAAHAICDTLLEVEEAHSPQWLGIFIALLDKTGYAPYVALTASAESFGLRHIPRGKIGPRKIRKHYSRARRHRRCYSY